MLRRGGLSGSQATSVVVVKGLVHTLLLAAVALRLAAALGRLADHVPAALAAARRSGLLLARLARRLALAAAAARPRSGAGPPAGQARRAHRGGAHLRRRPPPHARWRSSCLQLVYWVAMFSHPRLRAARPRLARPIVPIVTGQAVMQVLMPLSPLPGGRRRRRAHLPRAHRPVDAGRHPRVQPRPLALLHLGHPGGGRGRRRSG